MDDVPPAPPQRSLADELRRVAWALPRLARFDEDAVSVVRFDADGATRALVSLPLALPFSVCAFLSSEAAVGLEGRPVIVVARFLLAFMVGNLSLPMLAALVSVMERRRESAPAPVGALLWWNVPSIVIGAAWAAWQPHLRLPASAAVFAELAVLVYPITVGAWLLSRTLMIPMFYAMIVVMWDLVFSGLFAAAVYGG